MRSIHWSVTTAIVVIGLSSPANSTTLQELFGIRASTPTRPQPVELSPITRDGLKWANSLGGGIRDDGSFYQPINVHQLYGINSLKDGQYRQRFIWDGDRVSVTPTRLSDGTVYFQPPANSVRGWLNGKPVYYQFSPNTGSILLSVQGNQVTKINYCYGNGVCR